ncbi:hypothetical protein [Staphylococcus sp. Mo2-1]
MFNDYLEQLTDNRDTTLVEVENAKQDALDALNDFQSVDTSNWQKHKLTEDDGYIPRMDNVDMSDLDSFMEINSKHVYLFDPINTPTLDDDNGYLTIIARSSTYAQAIFSPINDNTVYMNNKIGSSNGRDGWEPMSGTKVVLFEGQAKSTGEIINLNTSYENFTELRVKLNRTGGNEIFNFDAESGVGISINYSNVYGDNSEGKLYEMTLNKKSPTELEITSQRSLTFSGTASDDSGVTILKIWGVT